MDIFSFVGTYYPFILLALLALFVLYNSFVNVGGDESATLERWWLGKEMADGRTVALSGEVGVQARILGPGLHFMLPFIFKPVKHKYLVIRDSQIGIVYAITGSQFRKGNSWLIFR